MADSDFDLTGRIRLDTSDLDNIAGRIGGSFRNMAAIAATALGGIGLAQVGKAAIGVAADFQQTSIAFTTMLGSGEKAGAFLKDLKGFAASTPFEFPELATAASSLVSVGINADKVIPIMNSLGNATAGMGTGQEGIKRATIALQQMNAAGRITGEDLNQLRDAGIPVFDLLAAATGKSKEQVAALAQAGKLGRKELEQLMKALETGRGLERFNGLMEAQSKTLNGVISTLRDTLSNASIDFITPYLPAMAAGVQKFSDLLTNTFIPAAHKSLDALIAGWKNPSATIGAGVDTLSRVFEMLGSTLRTVAYGFTALGEAFREGDVTSDGFVGAMEILGNVLRDIVDAGRAAIDFYAAHTDAVNAAAIAVVALVAAFEGMKAIESAAASINQFTENLGKNIDAVKTGATETQKLAKNIGAIGSKTVNVGVSGAEKALELVGGIRTAISNLEDRVVKVAVDYQEDKAKAAGSTAGKGFLSGISGAIGGAIAGVIVGGINFGAIASAVGGALATIGTTIAGILFSPAVLIGAAVVGVGLLVYHFRKGIADFFTNTLPGVIRDALDLGPVLLEKGQQAIDKLREGASGAISAVTDWFAGLPEQIAYALGYLAGKLFVAGSDLITGLWNGAKDIYTSVSTWVTGLPQTISDAIGDVGAFLYDKGSALLQGLWNGVTFVWDGNVAFWTSLPGKVSDFIGDVGRWLYDKGAALLQGLWDGIQFVWNNPRAFFTGLAVAIPNLIGNALSWLGDKGRDIISGLAGGISDAWNAVTTFFGTAKQKIADAIGDTLGWLKEAGTNIIKGLVAGIEEGWRTAIEKAKGLGTAFLKGFNDAVGNKSPSRFMRVAGVNIMQGLIVGVDSKREAFERQIGEVARALDPFSNVDVGLGAMRSGLSPSYALAGVGSGSTVTIGDIHINGVSNADDVRGAIPELTDALRAAVGVK